MASEPTKRTNKICKTDGCGAKLRSRGFCVACYYQNLRKGKIKVGSNTNTWKHRLLKINVLEKTAICSTCGVVKIRSRGKAQWRCATDADERSKLYKRAYRASKKAMLIDKCEICGAKENLCWDHCHIENRFRGTLCDSCNKGLGMFRDSPVNLRKAAIYVENKKRNGGSL